MDIILMNSKNSQPSDPCRLIIRNISDITI